MCREPYKLYTVVSRATGETLVQGKTAQEAADILGITRTDIYTLRQMTSWGKSRIWLVTSELRPLRPREPRIPRNPPTLRIVPLYTVYNNKLDQLVCLDLPRSECCEKMGIKESSWYSIRNKVRRGVNRKWTITDTTQDCMEDEADVP